MEVKPTSSLSLVRNAPLLILMFVAILLLAGCSAGNLSQNAKLMLYEDSTSSGGNRVYHALLFFQDGKLTSGWQRYSFDSRFDSGIQRCSFNPRSSSWTDVDSVGECPINSPIPLERVGLDRAITSQSIKPFNSCPHYSVCSAEFTPEIQGCTSERLKEKGYNDGVSCINAPLQTVCQATKRHDAEIDAYVECVDGLLESFVE